MNPRVKNVTPLQEYLLELIFTNDEKKVFDLKPYLNFGIFGIDICPDTIYLESI